MEKSAYVQIKKNMIAIGVVGFFFFCKKTYFKHFRFVAIEKNDKAVQTHKIWQISNYFY